MIKNIMIVILVCLSAFTIGCTYNNYKDKASRSQTYNNVINNNINSAEIKKQDINKSCLKSLNKCD